MSHPDLPAAWDELHDATPEGWVVGRPYLQDERREWELYAFIPSGQPRGGRPKVEWIAVGDMEAECVREMAPTRYGCRGDRRSGTSSTTMDRASVDGPRRPLPIGVAT